jgi:RHS repeat-associated protein
MVDAIIDNKFPGTTPPFTYGAQSQSFTYTPAHRLASASGYYGSLSWTYDGVGNRLNETKNGVLASYTYPLGSNRLSSVATSSTMRAFTYDAAGNILTDSRAGGMAMTFQYDVEGRLSKAFQTSAPANGGTYAYDALGRLASRTVTQSVAPASATTLYVYDLNDHLIAETDTSGATLREYIWLDDLPVAVIAGVNTGSPQIYYVHTDHLGRPARMTAPNTAWAWDVIYSPFGETSYIWSNPATLDLRFPGQWFQLETGLAYNWHRHYDASLGRYVQPDPIGYDGGRSLYGYVGANPLAYSDAEGLVQHVTGQTIDCGKGCSIRIDYTLDPKTGDKNRHLHRECKGKSRTCGEFGAESHGDSWDLAPEMIKECARKAGFIGETAPHSSSFSLRQKLGIMHLT